MIDAEIYRTSDNRVSKYIHESGAETAVKVVKSLQNIVNPITLKIEKLESDRNKYSIFISSSVGCYMKCKFCHLTLKNAKYLKLKEEDVISNIKEAILDSVEFNEDLKKRYIKLSWMGMGDAINNPEMVYNVTLKIIDWVLENNYAKGLDGVDLSTVLPEVKEEWVQIFHTLEDKLKKYPLNPIYKMDNIEYANKEIKKRNIFRLFFSIGSPIQDKRNEIIPNCMSLKKSVEQLKKYENNGDYTVILHHLLVDGLNDSENELKELVDFVNANFSKNELRILRYNFCAKSKYKESEKFINQIRFLSDKIKFLKVQVSPGEEVQAACGQFIVKKFVSSSTI